MRIIDTHSHIFSDEFSSDISLVVERAKASGIDKILMPNIDTASIPNMLCVSERYPGYCLPMIGLHPTSVTQHWKEDLHTIKSFFKPNTFVAVGEVGIDLYWSKDLENEQMQAFEEQLHWAKDWKLPISVHSREALNQALECIQSVSSYGTIRGVMHSFTGTRAEMDKILSFPDLMIGINGVVTFKNSTLRKVLSYADISRIVVETDAPYLTPAPYRGKRNEPQYTQLIVQELAVIFNKTAEEVAEITTNNARKMFDI